MTSLPYGLLLFSDYTINELAELAALAENCGYRDFWYTDVRFGRDCYLGLAAAAARALLQTLFSPGVMGPSGVGAGPCRTSKVVTSRVRSCSGQSGGIAATA